MKYENALEHAKHCIALGANINFTYNEASALTHAIDAENAKVAEFLLSRGSEIREIDQKVARLHHIPDTLLEKILEYQLSSRN